MAPVAGPVVAPVLAPVSAAPVAPSALGLAPAGDFEGNIGDQNGGDRIEGERSLFQDSDVDMIS